MRKTVGLVLGSLLSSSVFAVNPVSPNQAQAMINEANAALEARIQKQIDAISGGGGGIGPDYKSSCFQEAGRCLIFTTAVQVNGAMQIDAASNYFNVEQPTVAGIAAANAICTSEGIKRFGTSVKSWKAWLSDDEQNAGTAVYLPTKNYINLAGVLVAPPNRLIATLGDIRLLASIASSALGSSAWTGTNPAGNRTDKGTCSNWTRTDGDGSFGISTTGTGVWTDSFGTRPCNSFLELYCLPAE